MMNLGEGCEVRKLSLLPFIVKLLTFSCQEKYQGFKLVIQDILQTWLTKLYIPTELRVPIARSMLFMKT
jgi:hypothetical protein